MTITLRLPGLRHLRVVTRAHLTQPHLIFYLPTKKRYTPSPTQTSRSLNFSDQPQLRRLIHLHRLRHLSAQVHVRPSRINLYAGLTSLLGRADDVAPSAGGRRPLADGKPSYEKARFAKPPSGMGRCRCGWPLRPQTGVAAARPGLQSNLDDLPPFRRTGSAPELRGTRWWPRLSDLLLQAQRSARMGRGHR